MNRWLALYILLIFQSSSPAYAATNQHSAMNPANVDSIIDPSIRQKATDLELALQGMSHLPRERQAKSVILSDASDTIEALALQGDFSTAQHLCDTKVAATQQLFGEQSGQTLDAIQDDIFLASQQHKPERVKQMLHKYANVVAAMRQNRRATEVEASEEQRRQRLQTKLDDALATIRRPL